MAEGRNDSLKVSDLALENIEEDLNKLYLHTVIDSCAKGAVTGPEEIIEDFALILSGRIGGNITQILLWILDNIIVSIDLLRRRE